MNVLFAIRSLGYGGAERQLCALARGLAGRGHRVSVAVLYSGGALEDELRSSPVTLIHLGKRGRWDLRPVLRLAQVVRAERPDVVQGYLEAADVLMVGLKPLLRGCAVVCGIFSSNVELGTYRPFVRLSFRLDRLLARFADLVIVNSQASRRDALGQGIPDGRIKVIPNPVDLDRFRPDDRSRERLRSEWGVPPSAKLVGIVARLDPMKDHPSFLSAAAGLASRRADVFFVCVGEGPQAYAAGLAAAAQRLGLDGRLRWVGARSDMESVYNSLDVLCLSSSFGEGLPNVVGEAMACGIPCVVTDVGDAAWLVGDRSRIVPPRDPEALSQALGAALDRDTSPADRALLRERVRELSSLDVAVALTESAFLHLLAHRR